MRDEGLQHVHPRIGQRPAQDGTKHIVQLAVDSIFDEHMRLASGRCYGGMRFYDRGGLAGKRAMLAITVGGQPHMLVENGIQGELNDMLRPILRGTLAYTGMDVLQPFVAHHVPYISQESRVELLGQYRRRLKELEALTPLQFPSMDNFNSSLRPIAR